MSKKMIVLSGMLVIVGGIASLGVIANNSGMIKKEVNAMPEGKSEYAMTDQELQQLEQELKTEEMKPSEAVEPTAPMEEQPSVENKEESAPQEEATPEEMTAPMQQAQPAPAQAPAVVPALTPTAPDMPMPDEPEESESK